MSEEDVATIQAICAVSKQRAAELLEAASGVASRAVEIHLQQQQAGRPSNASVVAIDDESDQEIAENEEQRPKKKTRISTGSEKPNATNSNATKAKSSKQGTLHTFLGIEKKEAPAKRSQPTIDSFFKSETVKKINGSSIPSAKVASITSSPQQATTKSMDHKENGGETVSPVSIDATESRTNKIKLIDPVSSNNGMALKPKKEGAQAELATPKKSITPKPKTEEAQAEPVDPRLSYKTLASAFSEIVATTKRNAKLSMIKDILKGVILAVGGIHGNSRSRKQDARTLTFAIELICGKISQKGVTPSPLQVSGAAVSGALKLVAGGVSKSRFREAYRKMGDLGDVAAEFFSPKVSKANFFVPRSQAAGDVGKETATTSPKSASIAQIHTLLQSVANVPKGIGSQKERHNILLKLLRLTTTKEEMRFLVRILIGNMRLGATMKSILAALAMSVQEIQTKETSAQDPAIQTVQKTFDICPRINRIALSLLCGGIERMVKECSLEVGIPIQPSLANPAHSLEEVEKFMSKGTSDEVACSSSVVGEYKYDGVRCQAHYDGHTMKLFSRHLIDNTQQYPDASRYILDARKDDTVETFIIDAEIVAVARDKKDSEWRLLPFQILSTRRGTKNNSLAVQIRVFAFDLTFLNGESLIKLSLWERQRLLAEKFKETDGFTFATSQEFTVFDEVKITSFLQEAVKGGAEGLMMKLTGRAGTSSNNGPPDAIPRPLPTPYESGNRSTTWLKLKRDYVSGFADTLDVVPIGAWYGNGRKAEKGFLSPILFAVYDEDDGVFRSISRCMSFTDDMYTAIREFYFRGAAYPADVGLGDDTGKMHLSAEEEANGDDSGSEGDGDGGEEHRAEAIGAESDDSEDKDDDEVNSCGINCFPSRPSTSVYVTNESPTIWFKPLEVWEVSFADLTLSRTHTAAAGLVDDSECRGVALRFPRFKRRRPDKGVEQATTSVQIAELFSKQYKQR